MRMKKEWQHFLASKTWSHGMGGWWCGDYSSSAARPASWVSRSLHLCLASDPSLDCPSLLHLVATQGKKCNGLQRKRKQWLMCSLDSMNRPVHDDCICREGRIRPEMHTGT